MIRAFAALALPDGHRVAMAAHLALCARAAPGFRWVAPESLHLTLRFAGDLPEEAAARLAARLGEIRRPPFEARLGERGSFGSRRASVIWLGLAGGIEEAAVLAGACEAACREAGLDPQTRRFRPHVTLARARDRRGAPMPALPPPPELPPWRAEEFILYRSELHGSRPPVYRVLERYPLRD